jgi:excinuclease ABC subunit C
VDLLRLAEQNAEHAFHERRRAADDVEARLLQLQKRLRLEALPRRIECCDISHLGGTDTVGAIVALENGQPDKKRYRTFNVRGVAPGDDYGAMYQVLARRFRRGRIAQEVAEGQKAESEAQAEGTREHIDWDLPDLFVVDGGRGQLNVALAAARDLGLHDLPIVALAKEHAIPGWPDAARAARGAPADGAAADASANAAPHVGAVRGHVREPNPDALVDRVYLPGQKNGIPLQPNSAPLFFLARARDEAHRFSNRARERLGKARRLRSELDDIPGIGPVTRKALLTTLGSLQAVRNASDAQLLAVPGMTERTVAAIRARFPAK